MAFEESPTLAVDRQVRARIAAGEQVLHLAFGEAGLPVLPEAAAALASGAHLNSYGPVAGSAGRVRPWLATGAAASCRPIWIRWSWLQEVRPFSMPFSRSFRAT
jgi:hypothetical protein